MIFIKPRIYAIPKIGTNITYTFLTELEGMCTPSNTSKSGYIVAIWEVIRYESINDWQ